MFFTLPALAENTILIVGDSLSAGLGIDPVQGWVSLLKQRLKKMKYDYQIINASISGDTLSNGLSRLPAALATYKPAITIIELGGNDGLRALPLTLIQKNINDLVAMAQSAGSQVLVLGVRMPPNYGPAYTQQFEAIYQRLARRRDIAVVPLFLKGVDDHPDLMQSDGIHPVVAAQALMLENVWPVLKPILNKP